MDTTAKGQNAVRYDVGDQEDRPWGRWRVVDIGPTFISKRVEVHAGHRLSLQFHHHRSEHWRNDLRGLWGGDRTERSRVGRDCNRGGGFV
jgi:hypothetical protein